MRWRDTEPSQFRWVHNGSMYSNSVTTGHFEDYIWHDVVSYIDQHYRTLPDRDNRGIVGHSMKTDTSRLHEILDTYNVTHAFESYPGTHTSRVAFRFQDHVIFFSTSLAFAAARR